jgi:hypothetical protein
VHLMGTWQITACLHRGVGALVEDRGPAYRYPDWFCLHLPRSLVRTATSLVLLDSRSPSPPQPFSLTEAERPDTSAQAGTSAWPESLRTAPAWPDMRSAGAVRDLLDHCAAVGLGMASAEVFARDAARRLPGDVGLSHRGLLALAVVPHHLEPEWPRRILPASELSDTHEIRTLTLTVTGVVWQSIKIVDYPPFTLGLGQ